MGPEKREGVHTGMKNQARLRERREEDLGSVYLEQQKFSGPVFSQVTREKRTEGPEWAGASGSQRPVVGGTLSRACGGGGFAGSRAVTAA